MDRPDQLKLLRDVASVSLGTRSAAAVRTGMALENRGSREILCVHVNKRASGLCACLPHSASGIEAAPLSKCSAPESGGLPAPFLR